MGAHGWGFLFVSCAATLALGIVVGLLVFIVRRVKAARVKAVDAATGDKQA